MQGIKVNENGKICISLDNKDFKHKGLVMLNMEYDEKEDIIELKNMLKLKDSSYNSSEKKYLRFYSEVGSITLDSYDLDKKIAYLTINERLPSTYNVNTIENTGNRYSLYDYLLKINLENSIKMQKEVDSEISNSIKTFCMTNIIIFILIMLFMYTVKKAKQSINKKWLRRGKTMKKDTNVVLINILGTMTLLILGYITFYILMSTLNGEPFSDILIDLKIYSFY